jgi:hypothetical protein
MSALVDVIEQRPKSSSLVPQNRPGEIEKANGCHGPQLDDYAERRALGFIRAALEHFGIDLAAPRRACKKRLAQRGVLTPQTQLVNSSFHSVCLWCDGIGIAHS